jgi:glutamate 5-kinase
MLYKRIVAKFGTNLLTGGTSHLNRKVMSNLAQQIARLHNDGHEIIIVSSGAVAAGRQKLAANKKRKDVPFKQVLASIGQNRLMYEYEQIFSKYNITIAQALLTKSDLSRRAGYLNARNTMLALMELGVICIVNENDVVATDEIQETRFGDNDNLSAMVASLIDADLLILLTDIDGLYSANPRVDPSARMIERVEMIDQKIQRIASRSSGTQGVGGMATKIEAAKLATACGITVVIANGLKSNNLRQIAIGNKIGTIFPPGSNKIESKKRWMLSGLASRGKLIIDSGASLAIRKQNKSLLPAGIVDLEGKFQRGDVVNIFDEEGKNIGCGISNYSANEIVTIKGTHSNLVSRKLGYEYGSEIIHRNNMAII